MAVGGWGGRWEGAELGSLAGGQSPGAARGLASRCPLEPLPHSLLATPCPGAASWGAVYTAGTPSSGDFQT